MATWQRPKRKFEEAKRRRSRGKQQNVKKAESEVHRMENEVKQRSLSALSRGGVSDIGPISRWMVRTRDRIFRRMGPLGPSPAGDEFGRDVLSRVFWVRESPSSLESSPRWCRSSIGVTYGAICWYVGGWVDDLMMRLSTSSNSLPFIFIVIFDLDSSSEDTLKARLAAWGIDRITIFYLVCRSDQLANDGPRRSRPSDFAAERVVCRIGPSSAPAKRESS